MTRGWEVELYNGDIYQEDSYEWREVPKIQIKRLTLFFDGRRWDLQDKQAYFIRNTASVVPGVQESYQVEKRCIGYYEGADKVCYIINEFTGELQIKVE